jgi:hypothetical protein
VGIRARKKTLIASIQFQCRVVRMPPTEIDGWVLMLRRARTPTEQDQVMQALDHVINGWKKGTDQWSVLRQELNGDED